MSNQAAASAAKKQSKIFGLVLSLLFLAGFAVLAFLPDVAGHAGDGFFDLILKLFKDGTGAFGKYAGYALYGVTGFYGVAVILTAVSLFVKAKGGRVLQYIEAALGVIVFALFISALELDGVIGYADVFTSVNAAVLSLGAALLYLIVLNFATYRTYGLVKLLFFAIAAAFFAFYGFQFVGENKFADLLTFKLSLGTSAKEKIAGYAFMALSFGAVANLAVAGLDLILPKTRALDLVRTIAYFIVAVFAFVMLAVLTSFQDISDYSGTVFFLGLAAVQGFVAIIVYALGKRAAKKRAAEDEGGFVFDSNDQMAIKGLEAQPAKATAEQAQAVAKTSSALDDAAQISIDELVRERAAEEESAATQAAEEENIAEAEESAAAAEEAPVEGEKQEEQPFDFEQAQYDGAFNRAYADFAQQKEAQQKAAAATAQSEQDIRQQETKQPGGYESLRQQAPYTYGQGYAQQLSQNYGMPYYGGPLPYLPDAFINSLSPSEKDEFDRLFISRIYGENKRLPMYRVGGDNREFFSKVFVFIGRYRNVISDGLLEKIYNQSNLLK